MNSLVMILFYSVIFICCGNPCGLHISPMFRPFSHPLTVTRSTLDDNKHEHVHLVFTQKSFQYMKENRASLEQIPRNFLETTAASQTTTTEKEVDDHQLSLYFCQDLYFVTKLAKMENICSKDMQLLMYRLANHKNIFKTRQLLRNNESVTTEKEERNTCASANNANNANNANVSGCDVRIEGLRRQLHGSVEEVRRGVIATSKFQNTFCTTELLNILLSQGYCDQLYCVED
jgi:hypothetical protein